MLAPLRSNPSRRQTATPKLVPAPYGGWNARDDITDMPHEDAIVLDNLIPGDASVELRKGYSEWVTGLGSAVQALMEYSSASANPKLFGATASAIYDVSTSGAVGAAAVSSLSNGRWQHCMFATSGGQFLVIANGADSVRNYDGSSWSTPSITNVTSANLITVTSHGSRLWFVEDNTMKVWYLPTLAVAGAATSIDFGGLSKHGGKLMAMASWTRDGGAGMEDLAAFITSKGEVHIYGGIDPAGASWARIGTFKIAEPIGRRCVIKVGGDVGILTSQGLVPLSGILSRAESAQGQIAITDKIRNAYTHAYVSHGTKDGWQVVEYPVDKLLLVNIPETEDSEHIQFAMNARNGKWCRFTGLNGGCWSTLGDGLYFGAPDGTVYKYSGTSDLGVDISATAVGAFSEFGSPNIKNMRRILPRFFGPTGYRPQIGLRFDYADEDNLSPAVAFDSAGTAWDEGDYDESPWAPPDSTNKQWQGVSGQGTAIAVVVAISTQEPITYHGSKLSFEVGDHI